MIEILEIMEMDHQASIWYISKGNTTISTNTQPVTPILLNIKY